MEVRLDLVCPIPWRREDDDDKAKSPIRQYRERLDLTLQSTAGPSRQAEDGQHALRRWISRRYYESLWLGEHHSPLCGFLQHMDRLVQSVESQDNVAHSLEVLSSLLLARDQIRQRLSGSVDGNGLASRSYISSLASKGSNHNDDGPVATSNPTLQPQNDDEIEIVRQALLQGPAQVVAGEARRCTGSRLGKFGRVWIDAIETREIQLQILVILCLLQLHAKHPSLAEKDQAQPSCEPADAARGSNDKQGSSSSLEQAEGDGSSQSQKKRKRKVDKAYRWTGGSHMFPWQMGRHTSKLESSSRQADGSLRGDQPMSNEQLSADPKELSKRLEGLIDALCLRVSTVDVAVDLDADRSNDATEDVLRAIPDALRTPGKSPAAAAQQRRAAGQRIVVPPFGSEGRKRESERDERDVLQWFCCQVVEAHFSKTLPRQCGTIRSRCYLPASLTPSKSVKKIVSRAANADRESTRASRRASQSYTRHSPTPEPGPLQRSLLDEGRKSLRQTQDLAAAKRRTSWNTREVSVRRRWERSVSLGTTSAEANAGATTLDGVGVVGPRAVEVNSKPLIRSLTQRKEQTKKSLLGRPPLADTAPNASRPNTLVLDTPAKPRLKSASLGVHALKTGARDGVAQMLFSQVPTHVRPLATSPWQRSESQPVLSLDSSFDGDEIQASHTLMDAEDDLSECDSAGSEDDCGEEILDESLRQIYSGDEDEAQEHADENQDVFRSYMSWLAPEVAAERQESFSGVAKSPVLIEDLNAKPFEEGTEAEERVVLSKRIRSMPPSSLWPSFAMNQPPSSLAQSAAQPLDRATSDAARLSPRRAERIGSPRRLPTGRNPFAK